MNPAFLIFSRTQLYSAAAKADKLKCNFSSGSALQAPLLYRKFIRMRKLAPKSLLILLLLLCSACATAHREAPFSSRGPESYSIEAMNDLAIYAVGLAETPYHYGGNSPENGFDCSGFVYHVYLTSLGLQLPRTSVELSRVGDPLKEDQLRPGDLVFFNTQRQPYSHVGIYVGENRFVHAPKSGKAIAIVNMRENYWRSRYDGARRISSRR